jgi:O-antigen ligase
MMSSGIIIGIGVVFAALTWRQRSLGLMVLFAALPAYLIRLEIGPLPTNLFEIMIYLAVAIWIVQDRAAVWHQIQSALMPIIWPVVLLGVGLIIGIVVTPDLRLALGIAKGWFVDPLLLYLLVVSWVNWQRVWQYILALTVSTLPISGLAIWQVVTQQFITPDGRASGWFVSANYLSMYLVPVTLLGLLVIVLGPRWAKWLVGGIGFANLVAVYFSFSYGGWLGLLGGLVVLTGLRLIKQWRIWIWLGLIPIVAVWSQWGSERFVRMLDLAERSSASVRLQVWATGWEMFRLHPLTGIGLGQFRDQYLTYASRLFAPLWEAAILHAHNLFLHFAINLGLIGLAGFIWLGLRFYQILRSREDWPAIILAASLASILVHGLVDTPYWKNDLSALFWIMMALAVIWQRSVIKTSTSL